MVEVPRPPALFPPPLPEEDENVANPTIESDILSTELRSNFESIRTLLLTQSKRHCNDDEESSKKRKIDDQKSQARLQLAISSYNMIESELSRMRNGIEELEALLGEDEPEPDALLPLPETTQEQKNSSVTGQKKETIDVCEQTTADDKKCWTLLRCEFHALRNRRIISYSF